MRRTLLRKIINAGQLAHAYNLPCWDYGRTYSHGLGIANGGTSLLMLMDRRPDLRYAVSMEGVQSVEPWLSFFQAVEALFVPVAAHLSFMVDKPGPVIGALTGLGGDFDYYSSHQLPGRRVGLPDLLRECE